MINKDLKRLSRRELVDVIYQMKKNEEQLQEQIASLEEALEEKRIRISVAGSVAEAATYITNVLNAAQTTADLYLNEIACMKDDAKKDCAMMVEDAKQKVEKIMADGKKQYDALNHRYESDYKKWRGLQTEIQGLQAKKMQIEQEDKK